MAYQWEEGKLNFGAFSFTYGGWQGQESTMSKYIHMINSITKRWETKKNPWFTPSPQCDCRREADGGHSEIQKQTWLRQEPKISLGFWIEKIACVLALFLNSNTSTLAVLNQILCCICGLCQSWRPSISPRPVTAHKQEHRKDDAKRELEDFILLIKEMKRNWDDMKLTLILWWRDSGAGQQ